GKMFMPTGAFSLPRPPLIISSPAEPCVCCRSNTRWAASYGEADIQPYHIAYLPHPISAAGDGYYLVLVSVGHVLRVARDIVSIARVVVDAYRVNACPEMTYPKTEGERLRIRSPPSKSRAAVAFDTLRNRYEISSSRGDWSWNSSADIRLKTGERSRW